MDTSGLQSYVTFDPNTFLQANPNIIKGAQSNVYNPATYQFIGNGAGANTSSGYSEPETFRKDPNTDPTYAGLP